MGSRSGGAPSAYCSATASTSGVVSRAAPAGHGANQAGRSAPPSLAVDFRHVELSRTMRDGDRAVVGKALVEAKVGSP
ncbi:hypothetical protein OHS58_21065 [Amycolatopsis sp. NBC_00348]|uniref:hypothetical protein n=1 Tax=Amycolatopsis sp. NBC_00348 TaxID=2975956 RepID=UPI002E25D965